MPLKGIFFVVYFGEDMPLSTLKIADCLMIFYQRLIIFIEGLSFLTRRIQRGKVLYQHGGWLPYRQYSCSRNGLKLLLQREK